MSDDHHRAGIVVQRALQPGDAFGVEVIGRFIEQEQVGLFQQQAAQRDAAPLTTGQCGHQRVRGWAAQRIQRDVDAPIQVPTLFRVDLGLQIRLLGQQFVHLLVAHWLGELHGDFIEPIECRLQIGERLLDVLAHRLVGIELRFLFQIADARTFGRPGLATEIGVEFEP